MAVAQEGDRLTGEVKWFSDAKGYGFITPDSGGADLFVHHSDILSDGFRSLSVNSPVEFTFSSNEDKPKAVDVTGPNRSPILPPSSRRTSNGGGNCYECGKPGHLARNCREPPSPGGGGNDVGDDVGGGGGGNCYECGKPGHIARNCREPSSRSGGGGDGSDECYNCGGKGHFARVCPSGRSRRGGGGNKGGCYSCGIEGHLASDCPSGDSGVGSGRREGGFKSRLNSSNACYNCGKTTHLARNCPHPRV